MREKKCFNLHSSGRYCKALSVSECPVDCTSKITDPTKYINMLEDLMYYNRENGNLLAEYRKEVMAIREKYQLPDSDFSGKPDKYSGWAEAYWDSIKRRPGKGGGSSEKNTNPSKPRENDNRVLETKWNKADREEIAKLTKQWEEENGEKLEKLGMNPLSKSKIDSYTGEPI